MAKCKWCNKETINEGTMECNHCWDIRHSMECGDMDIVEKIYVHVCNQRTMKKLEEIKIEKIQPTKSDIMKDDLHIESF